MKTHTMQNLTTEQLLKLALLELDTERDRCKIMGETYDCLWINDVQINEVIREHLSK